MRSRAPLRVHTPLHRKVPPPKVPGRRGSRPPACQAGHGLPPRPRAQAPSAGPHSPLYTPIDRGHAAATVAAGPAVCVSPRLTPPSLQLSGHRPTSRDLPRSQLTPCARARARARGAGRSRGSLRPSGCLPSGVSSRWSDCGPQRPLPSSWILLPEMDTNPKRRNQRGVSRSVGPLGHITDLPACKRPEVAGSPALGCACALLLAA